MMASSSAFNYEDTRSINFTTDKHRCRDDEAGNATAAIRSRDRSNEPYTGLSETARIPRTLFKRHYSAHTGTLVDFVGTPAFTHGLRG